MDDYYEHYAVREDTCACGWTTPIWMMGMWQIAHALNEHIVEENRE